LWEFRGRLLVEPKLLWGSNERGVKALHFIDFALYAICEGDEKIGFSVLNFQAVKFGGIPRYLLSSLLEDEFTRFCCGRLWLKW
jgi:hypothetical protein